MSRESGYISVVFFFLITCAFTWALLPFAATSIPISLIALCGPAVAAFFIALFLGKASLQELVRRITTWRLPVVFYLLVIGLPILTSFLRSLVEQFFVTGGNIQFQHITVLSLVVFVLVLGEEIGWRGFALPLLLPRFGPYWSSIIIGVIWAIWHLPLFYMPTMPQHGGSFYAFTIYTIALSVILTWFATETKGSILIATLFHGAVNTFGFVEPSTEETVRGWTNAACYGFVAVILGLLLRRRKVESTI